MARAYVAREKRAAAAPKRRFGKLTQSTPGGSYDGKPAEDDPRFNPKKQGNKRSKPKMPRGPAFNQKNVQNV